MCACQLFYMGGIQYLVLKITKTEPISTRIEQNRTEHGFYSIGCSWIPDFQINSFQNKQETLAGFLSLKRSVFFFSVDVSKVHGFNHSLEENLALKI